MNPDFSQRPLIAGSFTGIRSWRVNERGILTGVHARGIWTEGENNAECRDAFRALREAMMGIGVSSAEAAWSMSNMFVRASGRVYLVKRPKRPAAPVRRQTHPAATLACQCGFYAYFDLKANLYHIAGNVLGLIEGYGTMTIGERGFRASKARIVALIEPVPEAVRGRYGVPIFSTVDAALAEFPLSVPPDVRRPQVKDVYREALQRRRERNTGPASRVGLDGRSRRSS